MGHSPSPAIVLEDLDREELLELFREKLMFGLKPSELWLVRWRVLARKALEARERELEAFTAYVTSFEPVEDTPGTIVTTVVDRLAVREQRRLEQERLDQAAKGVEAARDAAWASLEASRGWRHIA